MHRSGLALRVAIAWAASASMLAIVLALAGLPPVSSPIGSSAGWGWDRPDAFPQGLVRGGYLNRVADGAHTWSDARPVDPRGLARRLGEFRQGCSSLLLSDHRPLDSGDKAWLLDTVRTLAARLEGYRVALEAGADPFLVRKLVDQAVEQFVEAVEARGKDTPHEVEAR